jgi:hypothetical protein
MYRLVVIAAIVCASFGAAEVPAAACSCVGMSKTAYAGAAAVVFTGTVTRVDRPISLLTSSSSDPIQVQFAVDAVYKGDITRTTWVTTSGTASCGADYVIGRSYTVFPARVDGRLDSGLCHGDVQGGIEPSAYGLPPGHAPTEGSSGEPGAFGSVAPFLAVAIIALASIGGVLRRRRGRATAA